MADNTRRPREIDTRAQEMREEYRPPSALPDPIADPNFVYHWVAVQVLGREDPSNMSKKFLDGWEPVRAEDHPELAYLNANGQITLGGLLLCRMPKKRYMARKAYYENQATQQMVSVDNSFMRENDPRMPLFKEGKTTTTRGSNFGNG